MMTLNEAIRHAEEKACGNTGCAEEYGQLAKWLRELSELRSFYVGIQREIDAMNVVWRVMGKNEYDIFYKGL